MLKHTERGDSFGVSESMKIHPSRWDAYFKSVSDYDEPKIENSAVLKTIELIQMDSLMHDIIQLTLTGKTLSSNGSVKACK